MRGTSSRPNGIKTTSSRPKRGTAPPSLAQWRDPRISLATSPGPIQIARPSPSHNPTTPQPLSTKPELRHLDRSGNERHVISTEAGDGTTVPRAVERPPYFSLPFAGTSPHPRHPESRVQSHCL